MPYITTQAIVLHTADYRDNDRMLSLLTPEHGQLDALCRGCKKPQSPRRPFPTASMCSIRPRVG